MLALVRNIHTIEELKDHTSRTSSEAYIWLALYGKFLVGNLEA